MAICRDMDEVARDRVSTACWVAARAGCPAGDADHETAAAVPVAVRQSAPPAARTVTL